MMWINPDTRHAIALHAVTNREWMAPQYLGEQVDGLVRALRNVHPDNRVRPTDQRRDLGRRVRLDSAAGQRQHADPEHVPHAGPERGSCLFASFRTTSENKPSAIVWIRCV